VEEETKIGLNFRWVFAGFFGGLSPKTHWIFSGFCFCVSLATEWCFLFLCIVQLVMMKNSFVV